MAGFTEKMFIEVDRVSLKKSLNTLEQQNNATTNKITTNSQRKATSMIGVTKKLAMGVTGALVAIGGVIANQVGQIEKSVSKLKQVTSMLDDIDTTATQFGLKNTSYLALVGAFESMGASQEDLKLALSKFTIARGEGGALEGAFSGQNTDEALMNYLQIIAKARTSGEDLGNIQKSLQEVLGRGNLKLWDALQDPQKVADLTKEMQGVINKQVGGDTKASKLISDTANTNKAILKDTAINKIQDTLTVAQTIKNDPNKVRKSLLDLENLENNKVNRRIENLESQVYLKQKLDNLAEATDKAFGLVADATKELAQPVKDANKQIIQLNTYLNQYMGSDGVKQ